jgi:hypothetical protein
MTLGIKRTLKWQFYLTIFDCDVIFLSSISLPSLMRVRTTLGDVMIPYINAQFMGPISIC